MRFLLASLLLLPSLAAAQNPEQRISSRIETVTVFASGAQVQRRADTRLRPGTTDLVFGDLPPGLDGSRLQVEGEGDFTLLSVNTRRDFADTATVTRPEVDRLRRSVEALTDSIETLRLQLAVIAAEMQVLDANRDLGPNTTVEQIRGAADFYRARVGELKTRERRIQTRMATLIAEHDLLNQEIGQMLGQNLQRAGSAAVVTVSTGQAGTASFRLKYVVGGAGWSPLYDARVTALDRPVDLTFNARVFQDTGEDWDSVRLTLSTGDPYARTAQPIPMPWRIGFYDYQPRRGRAQMPGRVEYGPYDASPQVITGMVRDAATSEPLIGVNVTVSGTQIGTATGVDGRYRLELPQPMTGSLEVRYVGYQQLDAQMRSRRIDFYLAQDMMGLSEVTVSYSRNADQAAAPPPAAPPLVQQAERVTTIEYTIDQPYSLPSDGTPRAVQVERFTLPSTYTHYAAPRLDDGVYLTARLTNWDGRGLRSGPVNLYLEGAYVGTASLDTDTPEDTLVLSLGQDAGVVARREQVDTQRKRSFFGNRVEVARGYRIELRNTRARPVEMVVEDQIPISTDEAIGVDHDIEDGGVLDEETGIVRWMRTLAPGQTATLRFSYSVRYPRGRTVVVD